MAQQPTDAILYTFSARAPIKPGIVTILPYAATAAPDVDHDAKLTITRQFYDDSANHVDSGDYLAPPMTVAPPRSALRNSSQAANPARGGAPPSGVSSARATSTSRETTPTPSDQSSSRATSRQPSIGPHSYSRTYTPPPSTAPSTPSSRATSRQPSVAPTNHKEPLPHLDDFVPKRRPITRSISRGSLRFEPLPGDEDSEGRVLALDGDDDCSQYKRETWKIPQSDEEKARGKRYVTTWFYSSASYSLAAPPPCMSKHVALQLGDLFFHWSKQLSEPQIWWWIEGNDGRSFWKRVFRGQLRPDDNRRLSIATSKDGTLRPSWVSDTWFQKQEREMKLRKKKAKAKAKTIAS